MGNILKMLPTWKQWAYIHLAFVLLFVLFVHFGEHFVGLQVYVRLLNILPIAPVVSFIFAWFGYINTNFSHLSKPYRIIITTILYLCVGLVYVFVFSYLKRPQLFFNLLFVEIPQNPSWLFDILYWPIWMYSDVFQLY